MNIKVVALAGIFAFVFGILGGFVSSWFYMRNQVNIQTSSSPTDVVTAKKIVLIDDKGIVRASLNTTDTGDSVLKIKGKDSKAEITLGVSFEERPFFFISYKEGRPRIGMGELTDESPRLALFGKGGQSNFEVNLSGEADIPSLSMGSKRGITRVELELNASGDPSLISFDANGKEIQKLP